MNRVKLRAIRASESIQDSRSIRAIATKGIASFPSKRSAKQDKSLRKHFTNSQFIQQGEYIPVPGDGMRVPWAMKYRKGWIRSGKLATRPI